MMPVELLAAAAIVWVAAAFIALLGAGRILARALLVLGGLAAIVAALLSLPEGTASLTVPTSLGGGPILFRMTPDALWLMGFGLAPAVLAAALATPASKGEGGWLFGTAVSLLGALGVFGLQDGAAFLIAWEVMSFGGAMMILSERLSAAKGRSVLFMLALLEVGAVALLLAFLLLGIPGDSLSFDGFAHAGASFGGGWQALVGVLCLIGFGAKLGVLPFYEWFPAAYGSGSGASGAVLSSVVLNAAFFGLSRALIGWLPASTPAVGIVVVAAGTLSAVLAILYAFQQEDWRGLLSFSSAENASIAVATLGASVMFRADGQMQLAGLAWTVALLHLAGHSLAKGALFLAADAVFRSARSYDIAHTDLLRRSAWPFGLGALFAAMSLAAMPPQAGFVSEWYVFQTIFQGFHLSTLGDRLVLAIAGAGLALTAAVAFATFVKVLGIGLLGRTSRRVSAISGGTAAAVALLGLCVIALAAGLPAWLPALDRSAADMFGVHTPLAMHVGWVLVPGTGAPIAPDRSFAFISPSLLVIAMPILSLIPLAMLAATRRFPVRRAPVWYGGLTQDPERASTTGLTFSNALRTFYAFIYRPTLTTTRETNGQPYFIRRLVFTHDVAPIFGPYLFSPLVRFVRFLAGKISRIQSGHLNFYLALIGALLVVILALTLI
ncbi:proton-conducting transporter membrane subunit [Mesorhizobium sp. MSK_1335]|uniref:Proton-conducting transporter membrane subunit n=1 Tax=Mesorhizobium montanum TaxID=3072323 RepID=A0ABU4ZS48_9HYPH|nr:proton-conducting transporter membrane subunit [Mesorhizobium sp. MSK_1335]MDX8528229.1 proton-conducting transporter membrane subunit [Mesorhizobium sp. MSK_1335]